MEKPVLDEAKRLKFFCRLSEDNYWQILPIQSQETWKLTEADSQWILSLSNVPQLNLNQSEAIAFLISRANLVDDSILIN
ncbi:MAG: hypothetical protein AAGF83_11870 [Cyanobacteria bacterium P01_G01_bin.67]